MHFHLGETGEASRLVRAFHYSHAWPSPAAAVLVGTFHADGGLLGDSGPAVAACVFGHPAARWSEPVLELTRLVRDPAAVVPLSALVSLTARWVRRKRLADLVVSMADPAAGHHGGVYQACSWRFHGQREPRLDGGWIGDQFVPARTLNHTYGTQSLARLAELGVDLVPHYDDGKYLYWHPLSRSGRERADRLGLVSSPYPKPDVVELVERAS